jgi:serralysin
MPEAIVADNNEHRFCVVMTPDTLSPEAKAALAGRKAALLNESKWPSGSVIRIKFLEGDPGLQARVRNAAKKWTAPGLANVTLNFVGPTDQADVRIAFEQGNGSWSYLGTMCKTIPVPEPTMNYGWLTPQSTDTEIESVVLHEFGHALGLIHEHQNPQGGIDWNEEAVKRDLSGPPNEWDDETIRRNVLDKYSSTAVTATDVDPKSIMMYPIPKAWTNDGFSSGVNNVLSDKDKQFIKKCYP